MKPKQQWGGHTAAQTISAIVMASAAVFAVVFQSKGDPKFAWSLVALIALILLASALMYANQVLAFFRVRRVQAARDKVAREQRSELLRLAATECTFISLKAFGSAELLNSRRARAEGPPGPREPDANFPQRASDNA